MKLKKISLRSLNDNEMREQERSYLLGSAECGCGSSMSPSFMKRQTILSILVLLLLATPKFTMYSQRKDSDAKISIDYYKYGCLNRKVIDKADLRILYAFNPTNLEDKSTWIDEGQLYKSRPSDNP